MEEEKERMLKRLKKGEAPETLTAEFFENLKDSMHKLKSIESRIDYFIETNREEVANSLSRYLIALVTKYMSEEEADKISKEFKVEDIEEYLKKYEKNIETILKNGKFILKLLK